METEVFKALSCKTRLEIVKRLLKERKCLSDLSLSLNKDFSVIYRHIKILEKAGIVEVKKEGERSVICLRNPELVEKLLNITKNIYKRSSSKST